jgi:hypothetical protein
LFAIVAACGIVCGLLMLKFSGPIGRLMGESK